MSNSNETKDVDLNNIIAKWGMTGLGVIGVVVLVLYLFNFHYGLSIENDDWGAFGGYFGGILSPVIALFAFYLIAKTYELQKTELEATRSLLEVSTDAQKKQIKLAALTASLNSNLTNISILQSDKSSLLNEFCVSSGDKELASRVKVLWSESSYSCLPDDEHFEKYQAEMAAGQAEYESLIEQIKADKGDYFVLIIKKFIEIDDEIKGLINENGKLKAKIGAFLK